MPTWLWILVPVSAAAEPAISETELVWMAREVAPMVEEVAGRPFKRLPEVVAADPARIAEVVYQEQLHLLRDVDGLPPDEAEDHARRTATAMSSAFAGKYGFLDGRLYVSVEGIADSLFLEGGPEWLLRPLVRVVIAHELTHALQDQWTDLDALVQAAPNGDAIMAMNCAVEGHAVWVHEQVGRRLQMPDAVAQMGDLLGYDEPLRRRMDPNDFYHVYVYGLGRDFIAQHADYGGTEQVWRVLADPPDATRQIVSPEDWFDGQPPDLDADQRRILRRASRRLAGRGWRSEDQAMGDFDVRDQLVRAGADLRIADDLDMGWNSRLVGGAMAGVEVQLLRFKSDDGARRFVEDMRDQAEAQAEAVGRDPFISADAGAFDAVRADHAAHEAITVSFLPEAADHLGRVWVARGSDVVQVVLVNAPATDREVAATIEAVFRGLR